VTATFRTGRRLACVAVLVALPLTACAAGYQAETSRERTTLTSVQGVKGNLSIRNVFVAGPADAGGSLPLYLAAFNGGNTDDQLLSISSPSASGGSVPSSNKIPGGSSLFYNAGFAAVPQLTGLKNKALVGQTVTVTLTFAQAGELTLQVPIESSDLPGPSAAPSDNANATATPSASVTP